MSHSEFGHKLRRIAFRRPARRVTEKGPAPLPPTLLNDMPSARTVELLWTGPGPETVGLDGL
jgi:hypothetical protein